MSKLSGIKKCIIVSLLFSVISYPSLTPAFAETQFPLSKIIENDKKDIITGKLPNGFRYIIKKNATPEKRAEFRLAIKAGSLHEDDTQQGLAHFTEHMEFNGTAHFKKHELISYLQSIGVKFGADLNAYTSFDQTVYKLPLPITDPKIVEKGFLILSDWAGKANLENSEIDKERTVVLEEARQGKGAYDRIQKITFPAMFKGSKYAVRLPIGKEDLIKTFKYDQLKRFYRDWYRPDLMCLVVVGDFNPKDIEKKIKEHFSGLKMPKNPRNPEKFKIPFQGGTKIIKASDHELPNNSVEIIYRSPEKKTKTFGDYRNEMLRSLFSSMIIDRLDEIGQQPNPPFNYASAAYYGWVNDFEGYIGNIDLNNESIETAIKAFLIENEKVKKYGFLESELQRAKKDYLAIEEKSYSERNKRLSGALVGRYVNSFVNDEPVIDKEIEFNFVKEMLPGITLKEINALADKMILDDNRIVTITVNDKKKSDIPSDEKIKALFDSVKTAKIEPYIDTLTESQLLATMPVSGKIISEDKIKDIDLTKLTLSNGIEVSLKPTKFKNNQIYISGYRFGGWSLYSEEDYLNASNSSSIINSMGIGNFSPVNLQKLLKGKIAYVGSSINQLTEQINGQTQPQDLETALQLVNLYFTSPRKDPDLFKNYISKYKSEIENYDNDPGYYFAKEMDKYFSTNNKRPYFLEPEDLDKINLDRAFDIYKERFSNAYGYKFLFVGSFEPDKIKPLLEKYIASLPAKESTFKYVDLGVRPANGPIDNKVYRGKEDKASVLMNYSGIKKYSESEQIKIRALGEALSIKMIEVLREQKREVYSAGASGYITAMPYDNYTVSLRMPCKPENVEKIIKDTKDIINEIKTKGITEADLNKIKENYRLNYEKNIKQNELWNSYLIISSYYNTDPSNILKYIEQINALTVKDIQTAAQEYLKDENCITGTLFPEMKK